MSGDPGNPWTNGALDKLSSEEILLLAAEYGVDIVALKEGLRMSVEERLRLADDNAQFVAELGKSTKPR